MHVPDGAIIIGRLSRWAPNVGDYFYAVGGQIHVLDNQSMRSQML